MVGMYIYMLVSGSLVVLASVGLDGSGSGSCPRAPSRLVPPFTTQRLIKTRSMHWDKLFSYDFFAV